MEPMLSNVAAAGIRNEPRDLQSRLYREIGISAVAAALQVQDAAPTPRTLETRPRLARKAA